MCFVRYNDRKDEKLYEDFDNLIKMNHYLLQAVNLSNHEIYEIIREIWLRVECGWWIVARSISSWKSSLWLVMKGIVCVLLEKIIKRQKMFKHLWKTLKLANFTPWDGISLIEDLNRWITFEMSTRKIHLVCSDLSPSFSCLIKLLLEMNPLHHAIFIDQNISWFIFNVCVVTGCQKKF